MILGVLFELRALPPLRSSARARGDVCGRLRETIRAERLCTSLDRLGDVAPETEETGDWGFEIIPDAWAARRHHAAGLRGTSLWRFNPLGVIS